MQRKNAQPVFLRPGGGRSGRQGGVFNNFDNFVGKTAGSRQESRQKTAGKPKKERNLSTKRKKLWINSRRIEFEKRRSTEKECPEITQGSFKKRESRASITGIKFTENRHKRGKKFKTTRSAKKNQQTTTQKRSIKRKREEETTNDSAKKPHQTKAKRIPIEPIAQRRQEREAHASITGFFEFPDIVAEEGEDSVFALKPGSDLGRVTPGDFRRFKVGADDGRPPVHEAPIDDGIEGALDEGSGHFGAEVVEDQEVADHNAVDVGIDFVTGFAAELAGLKAFKDVPGGIVDDGPAIGGNDSGDGGGEEGFPKPWIAGHEEVPAVKPEGIGVAFAGPSDPVHIFPGGDTEDGMGFLGVPVQGKGLKALAAQIEHFRKFEFLFLGAEFPQAPAHRAMVVTGVPADRAKWLEFEIIFRQAHLCEDSLAFLLEPEVFLPEGVDSRPRVLAIAEGVRKEPAHSGLQFFFDNAQAGLGSKGGVALFLEQILTVSAFRVEFQQSPAQNFTIVSQEADSFLKVLKNYIKIGKIHRGITAKAKKESPKKPKSNGFSKVSKKHKTINEIHQGITAKAKGESKKEPKRN